MTILPDQPVDSRIRLEPLETYLVAVPSTSETTGSGLVLPQIVKRPSTGTVQKIGPDVKAIRVDDEIVYKAGLAVDMTVDGTHYLLIRESDVIARLQQ